MLRKAVRGVFAIAPGASPVANLNALPQTLLLTFQRYFFACPARLSRGVERPGATGNITRGAGAPGPREGWTISRWISWPILVLAIACCALQGTTVLAEPICTSSVLNTFNSHATVRPARLSILDSTSSSSCTINIYTNPIPPDRITFYRMGSYYDLLNIYYSSVGTIQQIWLDGVPVPADTVDQAVGNGWHTLKYLHSTKGIRTATFLVDWTGKAFLLVPFTMTTIPATPAINSNGGGASAVVSLAENQTLVTDVNSTDDIGYEGSGLTYSLTGGADQAKFSIDGTTGVLTFQTAPDFESPLDAGADNVYDVQVTVTDSGGLTDVQDIAVTVADVDEIVPTVAIQNAPAIHNGSALFNVTLEFSETVVNFILGDISVGNGAASNFVAVDGNTYTADITPDSGLDVTVNVAASVAQDSSGNDNSAATQVTVTGDGVPPIVTIQNAPVSHNGITPFIVRFEFSEDVTGFVIDDITVGDGSASRFVAVDGNTYMADITPAGTVDVTIDVAAGVAQDGAGHDNIAATQETVEGDSTGAQIRTRTSHVIRNFMARRADMITANEPDLLSRLSPSGAGSNGQSGDLTGTARSGNVDLAFSTSLRQMATAGEARRPRMGTGSDGKPVTLGWQAKAPGRRNNSPRLTRDEARFWVVMRKEGDRVFLEAYRSIFADYLSRSPRGPFAELARARMEELGGITMQPALVAMGPAGSILAEDSGFDMWMKGTFARADDGSRKATSGLLFAGVDYRFSQAVVAGLMGQFDWTDEKDSSASASTNGKGWMAGPYLAARLHKNLLFDGRVAWGQSTNKVSPFGTYTDSFKTSRWLARAQLTGDFRHDKWVFAPHAGLIYFKENQQAYMDANNVFIPKQSIALGRATFGPKVSYNYVGADGTKISPYIGVKGLWDFEKAQIVDPVTGAGSGEKNLRARLDGGVSTTLANGWLFTGEGFYDGIGIRDLSIYGGSLKFKLPLN